MSKKLTTTQLEEYKLERGNRRVNSGKGTGQNSQSEHRERWKLFSDLQSNCKGTICTTYTHCRECLEHSMYILFIVFLVVAPAIAGCSFIVTQIFTTLSGNV